jgi:hypothetical protein
MKATIYPDSAVTKMSRKGTPYTRQTLYVHMNKDRPPEKVEMFVRDKPLVAGEYTIDFEQSLQVRDNALTLDPVLVPAK